MAQRPVDLRVRAPKWLLQREGIMNRDWKAIKRAELKAVVKAFDVYRSGCAYCPGFEEDVLEFQRILNKMTLSHSAKVWGR